MKLRSMIVFASLFVAGCLLAGDLGVKSETHATNMINSIERRDTMSDTSEFGISQIGQIYVTVHDLDRAVAFYRDKLGMKYLFTAPPHMAFFDCGGIRLMLGIPEKPEFDHPSSIIYFNVDNIQKSYEALSRAGVRFEGVPHIIAQLDRHDLWMVHFRDSENNLMSLMSQVARE